MRLQQIFLNLLSNALKFTTAGYIKFKFLSLPPSLYFSVTDTGIGIKQRNMSKLFKPFGMIQGATGSNKYGMLCLSYESIYIYINIYIYIFVY